MVIKKAKCILYKPHPFIFNWSSVIIPFIITFLVLILFQPFNFSTFTTTSLLIWASSFGLIAATSVLVVVKSLQKLWPRALDDERWTVGKEVLLFLTVIIVICLAIYCLFLILNPQQNHWFLLQTVFVRSILISIFPILILVLYEQSHYQRIKWKEAQALNRELLQKQIPSQKKTSSGIDSKVILTAENQKMALQIDAESLLFIKSEGNYVEVYYQQRKHLQKKLVRNSLKAISEQLPQRHFFRCHNRYLVNVYHIQRVEGNARNLELIMTNQELQIPVSRAKSQALQQLLQGINK